MTDPVDRSSEYQQTIAYVHHMYDTRHRIFQFAVAINTGLLAVVFQYLQSNISKLTLSVLGAIITVALTLMARRSLVYLQEVEKYAQKIEGIIGYGLIRETVAKMPKGTDSSVYLFVVYWTFVAIWLALIVLYLLCLMGMQVFIP